jgi:hypothetical protein
VKLKRENLLKITDTSNFTLWLRELSTAGIPITNKLSFVINEINLIINREHNKNYTEIDKYHDSIKDNATFKKMGWDLFVKKQKSKSGVETIRYSNPL